MQPIIRSTVIPIRRARSALALALALATAAPAGADPFERRFVLEEVVVHGNDRTPVAVVERALGLAVGEPVAPDRILAAVDALREAELFDDVSFHTERGTERGRVRLVLEVKEKGVELRFGTGYLDLDGWYVVPAQIRADNRLGRGERTRLSLKIGYRLVGADLVFEEERAGPSGRTFWGASLGGYGLQRHYFLEGVEYQHALSRAWIGAHLGRRLSRTWKLEAGARFETMDADSLPKAAADDELRGVDRGDEPDFEDLPPAVAAAAGERRGQVVHLALSFDGRARERVASTPVGGVWGRVLTEGIFRESAEAARLTADLRAYRAALGGAFALRVRGGLVGDDTAFYDRFHVGGLYTVRGYPSQSLSEASGDTRFWSASLEFRGPLLGRRDRPTVMGALFADAGQGWTEGTPAAADISSSVGFGFRVRVPWLDSLGFDFATPLGPLSFGESFHANGALGWNF